MIRKIINIDENLCTGCGLCVESCHEGAIVIVNNKAKLLRDDFCDGFGDCLSSCPNNAISFVEKDTLAYDEVEVLKNKTVNKRKINWPYQIKLLPVKADFLENSNLVIASDCTAFAYPNFHKDFRKNNDLNSAIIIGCPKLDSIDYSIKLTDIFKNNSIRSITLVRMDVPCCKGMERAIEKALNNLGILNKIPFKTIVISSNGEIVNEK